MLATCYLSLVCLLYENVFHAMIPEGAKMSSNDYLCIKEITKSVPITLSTAYQGNEITGISNVLDSWKCQYIQQLQGIVVSYKNVALMSKNAYIKSDYPIFLCNVKATFELFIPTVGSIVKGKINRISYDYIGCLVHNTINVAIHCSRNEYDSISHFIALDKVILFEITHIGFKRKIIRVKGKITQDCINIMKNMYTEIQETGAVHHIFTSPHQSSSCTDSEEQESNNDIDSRNEMSESLCYSKNLVDEGLNHIKLGSSTKKKKSNKHKIGQIHNSHFETISTENENSSPSLLCSSSKLFNNSVNDRSHDFPKKKKEKSKVQTGNSSFTCESTFKRSKIASPNLLLNKSDGSIGENSTDIDSCHSKKKKKRKEKSDSDKILDNALFDTTLVSNSYSPKKKKSKKDNDNSLHIISPVLVKDEYSTDTCTDISSSSKKKKHKKSKSNVLSSPSLFSDSQSSSKEEIATFKIPKSSPKKQRRVSQDKFSATEIKTNLKEFNSSLHEKDILNPSHTSLSLEKTDVKTENIEELIEALLPYDPSLGIEEECNEVLSNDKHLDSSKKAKKRKLESPDKDGLPKKKKKVEESEVSSAKSNDKHKTKKKSREKPEKDSKKGKRKSKKKVISSKKKLPKLKKKKKEKGEKLKKKLKKSSKLKKKDVP